jgi:hypothetical protein
LVGRPFHRAAEPQKIARGRRSHDPPVLQVERKEAGTRATKREHSITLAAPAGDEADRLDQVPGLASTLRGAAEPQRSKEAQRDEAPSEPRPTATKRRPVRPPCLETRARSAGRQSRRGASSVDRHAVRKFTRGSMQCLRAPDMARFNIMLACTVACEHQDFGWEAIPPGCGAAKNCEAAAAGISSKKWRVSG